MSMSLVHTAGRCQQGIDRPNRMAHHVNKGCSGSVLQGRAGGSTARRPSVQGWSAPRSGRSNRGAGQTARNRADEPSSSDTSVAVGRWS